jgi:Uma2 family endonuclease
MRTYFFLTARIGTLPYDEASMNVQPHMRMDKAAFLAWADGREGRCELVGGHVVMMVGASKAHGLIIVNLISALRSRTDRTRWQVLADFGVDVGPDTLRYPDIIIDAAGGDLKRFTTSSPVFVAEVLSPSTAAIDLGDKAAEYLRQPDLAAYVVPAQDEAKAWAWVRGPEGFAPGPQVIAGTDAAIKIAVLGLELPLSEIYAGVVSA